MKLDQLNKIIAENKEGPVDEFILTVEQVKFILAGHEALTPPELKQHYLNQSPFWILSFLNKVSWRIYAANNR